MADITINGLTATTAPATTDEIGIWDVGAGQYKKVTRANLIGASITGGGTVALGGFTLTVPATGTAALRGVANTFTAGQIIDTTDAYPLIFKFGGSNLVTFSHETIAILERDIGTGAGPSMLIQRNSNASTPAAGHVILADKGGNYRYVWIDAAANVRTHSAAPTNANDLAGTVVGTQTSMAAAKLIAPELSPLSDVLERIAAGADAVRRFVYRSGSFNGQEFEGVVTDAAPAYGMDRDAEHPQGKSLNEIQIMGDLLRAVAWLTERVSVLEKHST